MGDAKDMRQYFGVQNRLRRHREDLRQRKNRHIAFQQKQREEHEREQAITRKSAIATSTKTSMRRAKTLTRGHAPKPASVCNDACQQMSLLATFGVLTVAPSPYVD